jgi:hypothetical protein
MMSAAADKLAADAEAFAIVEEVRTHERAGFADAAKAQLQKAAGGAFAARARHVDQPGRVAVGPERGDRVGAAVRAAPASQVDHSA